MMQIRSGNKLYTSGSRPPRRPALAAIGGAPGWLKWPAIIYIAGAFVYMAYSEETQSGLVGYLMAREIEVRGSSTGGVAFGIGFLLLALPVFAVFAVLSRVAPQLWQAGSGSAASYGAKTSPITWKRAFAISAIPLAVAAVAVPAVYMLEQTKLKETVYTINLEHANGAVPKNGSLVLLTGIVARPYAASYRYGNQTHSRDHAYAPLTASTWTPAEPVSFVVHESLSVDKWDQPYRSPYDFDQTGPVRIQGRLSRSLPVLIEREFQAKGVKLAPSYLVVDQSSFPNAEWAELAPAMTAVAGVMASAFTLYLMALMKFRQKKRMARGAGA